MKTIQERLFYVIARQLGIDVVDIKLSADLYDDLPLDSLDMLEILSAIDDEFEIDIPQVDAEKFKTVQQLLDYVTKTLER